MTIRDEIHSRTNLRDIWEDVVHAAPERSFLIFEDVCAGVRVERSYRQTDEQVNRYANALLELGYRSGDRIALYLPNSIEFIECFLAIAKIGAVIVPLDTKGTSFELAGLIDASGARAVICTRGCSLTLDEAVLASGVQVLLVGSDAGEEESSLLALSRTCSPQLDYDPQLEALSLLEIMFTSGTTASPKGVMITHANAVFSGKYVNWELAMTSDDRYATSMVASHVNFQLSAFMPVITAGATLILLSRYSAHRFWKSVCQTRATLVQGMALIVMTMLAQPVDPEEQNHCVRQMHYFLMLSDEDKERFEKRFAVPLLNNYGSTETLVGVVTDPPVGERRWPSVGQVGPDYELKICDESGAEVAQGRNGEICIRGEMGISLMQGYWQRPDATDEAVIDGWYHTGDWGYVDPDGWLFFVDRRHDLIKRNGESVASGEIENLLRQIPQVSDAAVVGVRNPIRGQDIHAFLTLHPGKDLSPDSVLEFCRQRLSSFKVPNEVRIIDELPRGEYGKVNKELLKTL